jgi:hypothetical protein
LPPRDTYDPAVDLRASIEFAYRAIRARVARGGVGWGGWPCAEGMNAPAPDQDGKPAALLETAPQSLTDGEKR